MTPIRIGTLSLLVAAVMFVTEVAWEPIFTVRFSASFHLPLWILFAVYGALQLLVWHMTRKGIDLTPDEVERWGAVLERVTPKILADHAAHKSVRDIAKEIESSDGIPEHVTLRYIVALARYGGQGSESGASAGSESTD